MSAVLMGFIPPPLFLLGWFVGQVQDLLKGADDEEGKGGRALAVQDVHAPAEYVWDRILDFGKYDKMVGVFILGLLRWL